MAKPKKKERAPVTDPFEDVDAKSITEIEFDQRVKIERDDTLPAAAKLTDLPLKWVLLTLIICIGIGELAQRVERKHLIDAARDSGIVAEKDAETADEVDRLARDREEIQKRIRELREKRESIRNPLEDEPKEPEENAEEEPRIPLTLESLRAEVRRLAGDRYDGYRRFVTAVALLSGAFGLILMAVFVRLLAAAVLGGIAGGAAFFLDVEPWVMWTAAGAGAGLGALIAPRLLLANMLFNVAIVGLVVGGVALGGGVYLGTGEELYAIFGLGIGMVAGALLGLKFARPLFLSAVLANAAGFATLLLWLLWGELYPHFWPVTFGGLMIIDAVATRIYHKVRWGRVD